MKKVALIFVLTISLFCIINLSFFNNVYAIDNHGIDADTSDFDVNWDQTDTIKSWRGDKLVAETEIYYGLAKAKDDDNGTYYDYFMYSVSVNPIRDYYDSVTRSVGVDMDATTINYYSALYGGYYRKIYKFYPENLDDNESLTSASISYPFGVSVSTNSHSHLYYYTSCGITAGSTHAEYVYLRGVFTPEFSYNMYATEQKGFTIIESNHRGYAVDISFEIEYRTYTGLNWTGWDYKNIEDKTVTVSKRLSF